jgi:WD40 repeat protein
VSVASPPPPAAEAPTYRQSPFKGLTPYSEEDARFFFGREPETEIITANLVASRLTLLYGESGVGKTSVLLAGVVHRLREELRQNLEERGEPDFAVVVFRSWRDDPAAGLAQAARTAVTEVAGEGAYIPEKGSLSEVLRACVERLQGDVLVILDQFEEYFLYHPDEDGEGTFAVEFPHAVNQRDLRVNFLVSMREDALAKLDRFKGRIPSLFENRLRVDHLQAPSARSALTGPIEEYNRSAPSDEQVAIEPELIEEVIDQVGAGRVALSQAGGGKVDGRNGDPGNGRVEAPYLQLVMTRLWSEELEAGSHVLRAATLNRLGGAERIVRTRLDDALGALPTAERDVAARVFQYLVTRSGSKIAHTPADLADYSGLPEATVTPVVEHMAGGDIRLLRPVPPPPGQDGEPRYEIFHDVLGPAVLDWRARYTHEQAKRDADQRARRDRRRSQLYGAIALGCLLITAAVGVLAFWAVRERHQALDQRKTARSLGLVSRAIAQLDVDPARSVSLATDALAVKKTAEGEEALRRALPRSRTRFAIKPGGTIYQATFQAGRSGSRLLVEGQKTIRLVDGKTGREIRFATPSAVWASAIDPAGERVATGHEDGSVFIWNARSGAQEGRLPVAESEIYALAFAPGGDRIVVGDADGRLHLWDVAVQEELSTSKPISDLIISLAFDPKRTHIVALTSSFEGSVYVWDASTLRRLSKLDQGATANSAEFSPDGRQVLIASEDGTARVWDAAAGTVVRKLPSKPEPRGGIAWATFSADGRLVATAQEKKVVVWNARTGKRIAEMRGHNDWVVFVQFSRDGNRIVSASSDGTARVWETRTGLPLLDLRGHTGDVYAASFSPDGELVVTYSSDGTARIWDVSTGRELRAHKDWVMDAAFSPDGKQLLTVGADGNLYLWDGRSGKRTNRIIGAHEKGITSVEYSPDGTKFVTASEDETAKVRDSTTGKTISTLEYYLDDEGKDHGHVRAVTSASFSPDGNLVVTASSDWTARIWNAGSGKEVRLLTRNPEADFPQTHGSDVADAAFSPDGKVIVTVGTDNLAHVWDAETGKYQRTFRRHRSVILSVQFDPKNAHLVVTASRDWTARVWNVQTGTQVALLSQPESVTTAAFSPDGKWIVTGGPQGITRVWDWRTHTLVSEMKMHADFINSATFSPDGRRIVTTSDDRTARMYPCATCVSLEALLKMAEKRDRPLRGVLGG